MVETPSSPPQQNSLQRTKRSCPTRAPNTVRLATLSSPRRASSALIYSWMFGPRRQCPCPMCTSPLTSCEGTALAVTARSPFEHLLDFLSANLRTSVVLPLVERTVSGRIRGSSKRVQQSGYRAGEPFLGYRFRQGYRQNGAIRPGVP
jgi:hypothetical protein